MAVHRRASRRRYVLLVLVLTAVTLITLDSRRDDEGPLGAVGRVAHTIVSPVEKAVDRVADPVDDWFEGLTDRGSLKQENERLRRELDEMRDTQRRAEEALRQNAILKELTSLPILSEVPTEYARVVNRSTGNFEWTITLDKGTEAQISPDFPVVGPAGLVGKVIESWNGGSKVRLLVDPDSGVGVRVLPGLVSGTAVGSAGSDRLRVDLDAEAQVEEGDLVVTSGLENSVFPEGLSVGRVVEVAAQDGGLGTNVRVQPWTDFDELEYVRVLRWVPGQGAVVSTTTTTTTTTLPTTSTTAGDGDDG